MPDFVHIDIPVDDPERAKAFYEKAFGWKVEKLDGPTPYWLISTSSSNDKAPPLGAGFAKREEAWQMTTPTIDVDSADIYAAKILDQGGTIIVPKTLIPSVGYLVTFKDTEGNIFSILETSEDSPFANQPG